jgi:hypothetical protein
MFLRITSHYIFILYVFAYNFIIKKGVKNDEHSRVCGNPIYIYKDLMYVVNHNKKTTRITERYLDFGGIQRGR